MRKHRIRKSEEKRLEEIRVQAVRRVLDGENAAAVIRSLGFSRGCIYEWLDKFRQGGWAALKSKNISGRPHRLAVTQQAKVYEKLVEITPLELGPGSALWTRATLAAYIWDQFQIRLSRASVGRLLHEFGLISKHPSQQARALNPAAMLSWQRKDYELIRRVAKHARAEIAFLDVACVHSPNHTIQVEDEDGTTSASASLGTRLISAFSPNGQIRFMVAKGALTAELLVSFLHRLIIGRKRPLFLIVPENFLQHDASVHECVASFAGRLRLFAMPVSAPAMVASRALSSVRELPAPGPTRTTTAEQWPEITSVSTPVVPMATPPAHWSSVVGLGGS